MSTTFERLSAENHDCLHRMAIARYLDGQCYEFAIALHRGLGWKLMGLMQDNVIRHVLAVSRYQKLWDVRGSLTQDEIGKPFNISRPYQLRLVSEEDLRKVRPVHDDAIEWASMTAQALWPKLLWRKHTLRKRVVAFMDDLEVICQKHGVWIRSPYPAAQIVLANSFGDEKGFRISPTMDGQYFFDRKL